MKGTRKILLKRILSYLKPYYGYLIIAIVSAILSVVFTLLAPVLVGRGIDHIIGENNVLFSEISKIIAYLAVVIVLGSIFQWIMSLCANKITYKSVEDIRRDVFQKINKLPLKYIDSNSHGDLISRVINDIEQISVGLFQCFSQFFTGIVTIIGTLVFMFALDVKITLLVLILTPISLVSAAFIAKKSFKLFREQAESRGELSGFVNEMISNQKIIKTFGYEERAQNRFEKINEKLYVSGVKSQFISALTNPATRLVNGFVFTAVGVAGAIRIISGGGMTIGDVQCFLSYANQYTKPFNEISGVISELQTAFASAKRVFDVIDEPDEISDSELPDLNVCTGKADIKNVDFSYKENVPLIQNLNLSVRPGQKIALVGPTGCGKTTIINLLMRFYDVTGGKICVDDIPITDINRKSLRSKYGMVLQETWLFSGTVRDNIAYGREAATEDEIIRAAKLAHAHGFIKRLPNGYNTVISESGGNISQGQKQLLCIARIMLTNPPMLILDEATSSIDTRTEAKIQQAFSVMMKGKTSFIVAHRLSTIREADIILVMRSGHVIEQGNHEELIKKGGFYSDLYYSQFENAGK